MQFPNRTLLKKTSEKALEKNAKAVVARLNALFS
jgi:hypothetical protein